MIEDRLGSTSLTTDANGYIQSELRYKAWGEVRYSSGMIQTGYRYTGQYSNVNDFGLMFYNARWYDSALGRFTSADTIVPDGVQGYDRYAYANNDPIKYVDPSGHDPWWNDPYFYYADIQRSIENSNKDLEQAFQGLQNLGVFGNTQLAMTTVVTTEYGREGIGASMKEESRNNYLPLDEAITRLYYEHCNSGGAWSPRCVQSFWGYMQAITDSGTPDGAAKTIAKVNDILQAKDDRGNSLNLVSGVMDKIQMVLNPTNSDWTDGCEQGNALCAWAAVNPNQAYYNYLATGAPDGKRLYNFGIFPGIHVIWPNDIGLPAIVVLSPNQLSDLCSQNGVSSDTCSLTNFP